MSNKGVQIQPGDPMVIAPCGINCSLCRAYIRDRNPCFGCRGSSCNKSNASLACTIKNCSQREVGNHRFCYSCVKFPCADLLHIDERYRSKYGVSVLANLESIRAIGVTAFVMGETTKWTCPNCGARLCMHKPKCVSCSYTRQVNS